MCGIFAAVGPRVSEQALDHVFGALHHRGPDGRGLFVDKEARLTIAHTRLAIIDLVTGDQPMESEDGSIVLSANGEIYDFERIRSALEAKGYRFKTKSDSEVIIYLYKEYGLGCFEHLRGEFAFLLYDKAKRLLIAARDRFGI
jgi:asparagine synthase (glutamine-hydrolysing)